MKNTQSVKKSKTLGLINMYKHKMKNETHKSRILTKNIYIYKKKKFEFIKQVSQNELIS